MQACIDAAREPTTEPTAIYTLLAHLWLLMRRDGAPVRPTVGQIAPEILERLTATNGSAEFEITQNDPEEPLLGYRISREIVDGSQAFDVIDLERLSPRLAVNALQSWAHETIGQLACKALESFNESQVARYCPTLAYACTGNAQNLYSDSSDSFKPLAWHYQEMTNEIALLAGSPHLDPDAAMRLETALERVNDRIRLIRYSY